MRLGKNRHLFAGHAFERFLYVRMRAILIGGIPQGDAVVVSGVEQLGQAAHAQLACLVGTAAHAIGAAALRQAAHFDLHGPQFDAVGSLLRGCAGK
jgi:hypothetical protein